MTDPGSSGPTAPAAPAGRRRAARRRRSWTPTLVLGGAFVVVTAAVAAGLADRPDAHLLEVFRPDGVWGRAQQSAQRLEGWFSPGHLAVALVLTATASAVVRRRVWPLVTAGAAGTAAAALGLLVKLALARPDPNGHLTWPGSYPSGHTLTAIVCAGLFWLLVLPGRRRLPLWAAALTGLAGAVMAACLLLEGAHFASDVLGGWLLGATVLAATLAVVGDRPGREAAAGSRGSGGSAAISPAPGQRAAPRRRAPARR